MEYQVGSGLPYARFVEEGTVPHVIKPRAGKILRFVIEGREVFAREVIHPGYAGKPFLKPSIEMVTPRLRSELLSSLTRLFKKRYGFR